MHEKLRVLGFSMNTYGRERLLQNDSHQLTQRELRNTVAYSVLYVHIQPAIFVVLYNIKRAVQESVVAQCQPHYAEVISLGPINQTICCEKYL